MMLPVLLQEEQERRKQAEEDAYWQDDDKHVNRKLQRKVRTCAITISVLSSCSAAMLK